MPSSKATKAPTSSPKKQSKTAPSAASQSKSNKPATFPADLQEQIRRRAYELFQQRNGHGGSPEQDWLRAESEIQSRSA